MPQQQRRPLTAASGESTNEARHGHPYPNRSIGTSFHGGEQMASNVYLKVKGSKQGDIKGSVTRKGLEGQIQVIAVTHEIISPRDAASGQATGKRQHKPIVITKEIDRSTPLLRQALVTNEHLTDWLLQFFKTMPDGTERCYFTIKLTDVSIASASFMMPNTENPATKNIPEYEELAFTYRKIEWTWTDGAITAQDDWSVTAA
jgi:type VI secretion system secreted protein Hcp